MSGAAAGPSEAVSSMSESGPGAGASEKYSLPGAGGDETSVSGEEAGVAAEDLGDGEADGVEADDVGALAGALGDKVGALASELDLGVAAGEEDVVGDDFGDGEAVGEVVGVSWAETKPAMAMKIRARTTTWRAIMNTIYIFLLNFFICFRFLRLQ